MAADLDALGLDELRRRRDAVREEEEALSYRRRLLHAQLDLVQAAASVRDRDDFESMLAEILSDDQGGGSSEIRAVALEGPPEDADIEPLPVDLVELDDTARDELITRLRDDERQVSERRRELLDELDRLQAELVQRYRRDGVDARQLLREAD